MNIELLFDLLAVVFFVSVAIFAFYMHFRQNESKRIGVDHFIRHRTGRKGSVKRFFGERKRWGER